jgi:hypothetical protein
LIFVAMTFVIGGPLGWVLVVAIPHAAGGSALIQGSLRRSTMGHMQQTADLHGVLVEAVDGLEDLKAAGAQGRFLRKYEEATAAAATAMLRTRTLTSWTMNMSAISQQAGDHGDPGLGRVPDRRQGGHGGCAVRLGDVCRPRRGAAGQRGATGHALPERTRRAVGAEPCDAHSRWSANPARSTCPSAN